MKSKVLLTILCYILVILLFGSCGKTNADTSPDSSNNNNVATEKIKTITGVVNTIDGGSILVDLVRKTDSPSADNIKVGATLYALTGETFTIKDDTTAAIILGFDDYTSGSISEIIEGDFLAVVLNGDKPVAIINAGTVDNDSTVPDTGTSTPGGTSTAPQKGVPDSNVKASYTVNVAELKVRSGPGTTYSVLGQLGKGARETGTVANGWLEFTFNGQKAYCSAAYLEATTGSAGVADSSESKTYVTTDNLIMRGGPGTTYAALGTLTKGTKVTGTVSDGWAKFTYNDKTVYCSAAYLKES